MESAVIGFVPFVIRNPAPHGLDIGTGGAGIFCCVRTVTPHGADATSITVFVLVGEAR